MRTPAPTSILVSIGSSTETSSSGNERTLLLPVDSEASGSLAWSSFGPTISDKGKGGNEDEDDEDEDVSEEFSIVPSFVSAEEDDNEYELLGLPWYRRPSPWW